ncbi:MAG: DUF3006 domain-containing protein [Clostridia bacterium]|nr:DUF3006 domain-containing protein [Clostridia bacterium]
MYYTIDRLEGTQAVLEDEDSQMTVVPLHFLPEGVKEQDVLMLQDDRWCPAPDEATRRRERILRLQAQLRRR